MRCLSLTEVYKVWCEVVFMRKAAGPDHITYLCSEILCWSTGNNLPEHVHEIFGFMHRSSLLQNFQNHPGPNKKAKITDLNDYISTASTSVPIKLFQCLILIYLKKKSHRWSAQPVLVCGWYLGSPIHSPTSGFPPGWFCKDSVINTTIPELLENKPAYFTLTPRLVQPHRRATR